MAGVYCVTAIGLLALLVHVYRLAYPRPYSNIPYHRASSKRLLGNLPDVFRTLKTTQDPSRFVFDQCQKLNSPVVQLFLRPFSKPVIFVSDPREVKDVITSRTKEFDRAPRTRQIYRPILPHCSLVKLTNHEFKSQRRLWEGLMSTSVLRRIAAPKMHRVALELVELLRTKAVVANGRPFYFFGDFDLAAFEVIWKVVYWIDLDAISRERNGIREGANEVTQPESKDSLANMPVVTKPEPYQIISFLIEGLERTFQSISQPLHHWYIRKTSAYKQKWASLNSTLNRIISDTRSQLSCLSKEQLAEGEETCAVVMGIRRELLARQGELGNLAPPTNEDIFDELLMFLIAGHETKATTLSWAVKFLTHHPEKQDKLRRALLDAHSAERSPVAVQPSVQDILSKSIPYLDACMEETFRLGNISSRFARVATTDTQVLGFPIPKGASVSFNPYVGEKPLEIPEELRSQTSRQSKENFRSFWDTNGMDEWVPERWIAEDGSFDPRMFPRLAFSAGPRVCYGRNLALQEFRITFTLLVLNFKFEALPDALGGLEPYQRILRVPRQCYMRVTAL